MLNPGICSIVHLLKFNLVVSHGALCSLFYLPCHEQYVVPIMEQSGASSIQWDGSTSCLICCLDWIF